MSWIENVRNKSPEQKIRIIYIITGVVGVLLIILWVFTSKIPKRLPKDVTIFKTFERGLKDVRDQYNSSK